MAVRPLVTTGVALVSAGAIVAGTPALFVPHDQVTVAAPSTAAAEAHKSLTQEQIQLLAFTITGAVDAFFNGYGGLYTIGQVPATANYQDAAGNYVPVTADTPSAAELYSADGAALYVLGPTGDPVRATAANVDDDGNHQPFVDADGEPVSESAPGDCSATGAACQDGFTGLAYYASDQLLPLGDLDNVFFEEGFTEFARIAAVTVAQAIDAVVPRLTLERRVNDFFEGGVTLLVQNLIDDNLPDGPVGTWVKGLNDAFFEDGITGAVTYVVNAIISPTVSTTSEESGIQALQAVEQDEADAKSGAASTGLPNFSKLLSVPTPKLNVESPWKKLTEKLEAPAGSALLKDVEGTENPVDGGTGTSPLDVELPEAPEAPKLEPPKAPEFKLPEFKAPELKLPELKVPEVKPDTTPKITIKDKEPAAEDEANTGADTKTGNKVAPPILFENGKPKGDYNGKKFLKKLKEAAEKATGSDEGSGDSGDK
ncbi:hypothetical protein VST63_15350 [Mycolicibacterium sp. 050232]|uniref:hypothetical protein n=1 Tax=Mycolicibacterium sp. 050232 TaxID=3113982 RepID=UPI002E28345A|nr:hypothetical protein [Mycolicibacterium sp. 050232]MED5813735.1 hypothetical protein [Mycolicibacterium sp. 050232]